MADAIDMIEESEALIAPDLRKGMCERILAVPGDLQYRDVTLEENIGRTNYRIANNIDFEDGDYNSSIHFGIAGDMEDNTNRMYDNTGSHRASLVNNESRVYKGGGWDDRAYWLVPGTRRFLEESRSSASLGFRCAMTRVGSPVQYSGN
jgi:hypothetical protein